MVRPGHLTPRSTPSQVAPLMWVSATATRNFMLDDPLLDWLELYGANHGFVRDDQSNGYDSRADYARFLFEKAKVFEAAVVNYFEEVSKARKQQWVWKIERNGLCTPDDEMGRICLEATAAALREGMPIVYQGMVCDPASRTYGFPDFLIRGDKFVELFPSMVNTIEVDAVAPSLKAESHHYIIVDSKYTTLDLNAQQELGNGGSQKAYKAQVYIYNRALGAMQGFTPRNAYVLGRGWKQGGNRSENAIDRLGPVSSAGTLAHGVPLAPRVEESVTWVRQLHTDGNQWEIGNPPSVEELRPNVKNTEDAPWHSAKHDIARRFGEITELWQVGIEGRRASVAAGVTDWRDPKCMAANLGVKGAYVQKAQALIDVNRDGKEPAARPAHVTAGELDWRPQVPIEFFVDFETVNNLDDNFSRFPQKGGQALIFMIGCGHMEANKWHFRCFTAARLDETSESSIIDAWIQHMEEIRLRLAPKMESPKVYHWSFAEVSTLESAYNSAVARHKGKQWNTPKWYDLLKNVVQPEPFVIRGSLRFGLKSVAKALHSHGLIQTNWKDGIVDGLGAMAAAWWADHEAQRLGISMETLPLMQSVIDYNEIDCKVMMETLYYLRKHH